MESQLGELRGMLASLKTSHESAAREASESRARLHTRVDDFRRELADDRQRIVVLEEKMRRIEPIGVTVGEWRAQRNFVLVGAGFIATVMTIATVLGNWIVKFLTPPPAG
ncbi:MAG: hypothetical protein EA385_14080 [Salinarimonadaceae bacterium]|nr:MAG: hypothetical protein EA385_14080 [Salinarimonadaceae bacterium]